MYNNSKNVKIGILGILILFYLIIIWYYIYVFTVCIYLIGNLNFYETLNSNI